MFEEAYQVARVLELVDIGPDLGLPSRVVSGGFATGRASGMKRDWIDFGFRSDRRGAREFDEDTADFFDLLAGPEKVFIAQEVTESEFLRLEFGLGAGVEWPVLGSKLLGRITCHPESFFVRHRWFRPWDANQALWLHEPAERSMPAMQFQGRSLENSNY